jgi:hypothetical protein
MVFAGPEKLERKVGRPPEDPTLLPQLPPKPVAEAQESGHIRNDLRWGLKETRSAGLRPNEAGVEAACDSGIGGALDDGAAVREQRHFV